LFSAPQNDRSAELTAKESKRLAQCVPSVLRIELEPEHADNRIAPYEPMRRSPCEIGQEREPFRLRQKGCLITPFRAKQLERSEHSELDHAAASRPSDQTYVRDPSDRPSTVRRAYPGGVPSTTCGPRARASNLLPVRASSWNNFSMK